MFLHKMMRILLTGAFGFVGFNLARALAAHAEVELLACDLYPPSPAQAALLIDGQPQVTPLALDVTDRHAVAALLHAHQPTHLIHAAAITPTRELEATRPTFIVDVNLNGTLNLLDAAYHCPSVRRVLLVSSSGVYGAPAAGPNAPTTQSEAGPLALEGLYAITKYSAELLGARYGALAAAQGGPTVTAVRLGPIYGPHEVVSPTRPRISQPGELLAALRAGRAVTVAGAAVVRDWTHVDDVTAGIWALLHAPTWHYPAYNLSLGRGVAFQRVVESFMAHGLRATWVAEPAAADVALRADQARLPMDLTRLTTDSGFLPGVEIAQGVARLVAAQEGVL
jgi:nucleoside-diphosphate-sugar epimerase